MEYSLWRSSWRRAIVICFFICGCFHDKLLVLDQIEPPVVIEDFPADLELITLRTSKSGDPPIRVLQGTVTLGRPLVQRLDCEDQGTMRFKGEDPNEFYRFSIPVTLHEPPEGKVYKKVTLAMSTGADKAIAFDLSRSFGPGVELDSGCRFLPIRRESRTPSGTIVKTYRTGNPDFYWVLEDEHPHGVEDGDRLMHGVLRVGPEVRELKISFQFEAVIAFYFLGKHLREKAKTGSYQLLFPLQQNH